MRLRDICYKISNLKLYHIDPRNVYTLTEFCEKQDKQKHHVNSRLAHFEEDVRALVCKACEVALKNFLKENGFNAGERTFNDMGGGESVREITFTERAAMRTQCRKLTRYIRLADFFVVDAFLALALGSAENFLDYVRPAGLADMDRMSFEGSGRW